MFESVIKDYPIKAYQRLSKDLSYYWRMYTDIGSAMYGFRGMFAGPAALVASSGTNSSNFGPTNLAHHLANAHPGHSFLGTLGAGSHMLGSPDKLPSAITISRKSFYFF